MNASPTPNPILNALCCLHCGADHTELTVLWPGGDLDAEAEAFVSCERCGAQGPTAKPVDGDTEADVERKAVELWSRRGSSLLDPWDSEELLDQTRKHATHGHVALDAVKAAFGYPTDALVVGSNFARLVEIDELTIFHGGEGKGASLQQQLANAEDQIEALEENLRLALGQVRVLLDGDPLGDKTALVAVVSRLAELLDTQDNAITSDPIFTVQRRHRQYGMDTDYCENVAWVDAEQPECPITDDATDPEERAKFALLEKTYDGEIDWPEDDLGMEEMWTRTGYIDTWVFVQPFLTLEAAEAYRKREAHNLGESRIYVESGYRNPQWQLLRSLPAQVLAALKS